jgi:hypothetical protein
VRSDSGSAMLASMSESSETLEPEFASGGMLKVVRTAVHSLLPYPDLPRRWHVRRGAVSLVTCKKLPGDDASGALMPSLAT